MRVSKFVVLLLAAVCAFGVSAPVAQATPSCSVHTLHDPFLDSGNVDGYWDFKCGPANWFIYAYPLVEVNGSFTQAFCNSASGNCIHQWGNFAGGTEHFHLDGWNVDASGGACAYRWKTHVEVYNANTLNLFAEYSSNILPKSC